MKALWLLLFAGVAHADPTGRYEVGVGYGTDDGFIAHASISQSNLFGTGNSLALDAFIDARLQSFDLKLGMPYFLDSDWRMDTAIASEWRELPGFDRQSVGGKLQFSRELGDHLRGFVGYRFEHVTPTATDTDEPRFDPSSDPPPTLFGYNVSAVRVGIAYADVDRPSRPRWGAMVGTSLEIADPRLGSSEQFGRVDAYASAHVPLGDAILHISSRGSLIGGDAPTPELIFLDGSHDLPGFLPGQLGPANGARYELLGRLELELPLARSYGLSLVGFYAFGRIGPMSGASTGVGVLWRSPLGPLELDLAFPLVPGMKPRLVFGLGA